ncbi:MAG: FtsX-like permease family protein [Bacteroidetes bacterium]|nr:FtsX-like permease family protein [Bacteroidota bacterium]
MISLISLLAISVGSFALITVLSSFNGFEEVVSNLYNAFDADLQITPAKGKYFSITHQQFQKMKNMKGVQGITRVVEENILVTYKDHQAVCAFKGIEPAFLHASGLDSMVFSGVPTLNQDNINYALVGSGVAVRLGLMGEDELEPLQLVAPASGVQSGFSLTGQKPFTRKAVLAGGVFSVEQEFDSRYILLPYYFAADFVGKKGKCTSIELALKNEAETEKVRTQLYEIVGNGFIIKDRFQQQPNLYKVMKIEKIAVYLILTFIMLIAAFNLVGALLMLAIEKRKDMMILISLGTEQKIIKQIIFYEGLLLSVVGGIIGVIIGGIACYLQQKFGIIKISNNPESTFVIDAYPIAFYWLDFVLVPLTVIVLGFIASYYPARIAYKKINIQDLHT